MSLQCFDRHTVLSFRERKAYHEYEQNSLQENQSLLEIFLFFSMSNEKHEIGRFFNEMNK